MHPSGVVHFSAQASEFFPEKTFLYFFLNSRPENVFYISFKKVIPIFQLFPQSFSHISFSCHETLVLAHKHRNNNKES